MLSKFLTYKTGVLCNVNSVTLRPIQSIAPAGGAGGHRASTTYAIVMAEKISVSNPPGYSTHMLSTVGSIEVLFDPWSLFSQSVFVQSIHIQKIEVYLERINGINNTRSLRVLMDTRKRARRAGQPVPPLGYPQGQINMKLPTAFSSTSSHHTHAALHTHTASAQRAGGVISSSSSESEDSDSSQDDGVLEEEGGHRNLRSLMAGTAAGTPSQKSALQ